MTVDTGLASADSSGGLSVLSHDRVVCAGAVSVSGMYTSVSGLLACVESDIVVSSMPAVAAEVFQKTINSMTETAVRDRIVIMPAFFIATSQNCKYRNNALNGGHITAPPVCCF